MLRSPEIFADCVQYRTAQASRQSLSFVHHVYFRDLTAAVAQGIYCLPIHPGRDGALAVTLAASRGARTVSFSILENRPLNIGGNASPGRVKRRSISVRVVGSSARFISNLSIRSEQGICDELTFAETDRGRDHSGYPVLTQSLYLHEAPN